MKYTAFGEIRSDSGTNPTDYHEPKQSFGFKVKAVPAFTHTQEQRFEVEFGLSYYVARWYDADLGHFISADTIIPQPGNALDWDRYAYVLWNPMRYTDPSGHRIETPPDYLPTIDEGEWSFTNVFIKLKTFYNVTLTGSWENVNVINRDSAVYKAVFEAVTGVAKAIIRDSGGYSLYEAFKTVFKNGIEFRWIGNSTGAEAINSSLIKFYSFYEHVGYDYRSSTDAFTMNRNLVVHEIGHVFDKILGTTPRQTVGQYNVDGNRLIDNEWFYPGLIHDANNPKMWIMGGYCDICSKSSEGFANMFQAWVFNAYDLTVDIGQVRKSFMDTNMPNWLSMAKNK